MAEQQATDRDRELWHRHRVDHDSRARAELIEFHTELVRKIAASMYAKRFRDHVDFEEYFQYGIVGLIESVDRYDPSKGAMFETFASYRIRGSILNGLEKMSEVRNQGAHKQRLRKQRVASLTSTGEESGGDLFDEMVEMTLGLAVGFILEDTGLVAGAVDNSSEHAYQSNHLAQLRALLTAALKNLPERESTIIRYHYLQGTQFDVIADMLGVTKGRVSQLHKRALARLREHLGTDLSLDTLL